ncbi:Translational activator GCN1 [Verticillium dahliae VDG2]|nr:Translational activator GCN1 [Verticillium dahliae VDG2]
MSEDREESRHLMPQTPNAKANFDLVDELLPPDHFDHRLSVDSKLSAQDAYKGHDGLASHDALHRLSIGSFQHGRASPGLPPGPGGTPLHYPDQSSRASRIVTALQKTMDANRGIFLVALSQLFGALMNLAARLLELEGEGMHPFQVLFARQSITMLCASGYMFWKRTPDFPLGNPEVRWLLIARGVSGFFGIYGMWYSMMYLPLAEATVITFLAPSIAGVACYLAFREPFTRVEQFGTLVAFLGVPALRFALPRGPKQWALLLFLGLMGFIMQFMLTKGMSVDRSNKANAMVFTHMLFAAGFDRWVFGHSMGWMSLAGCGLIIGSALYMVITKESAAPPLPRRERDVEIGGVRDAEGVPMLMEVDDDDDLDALDARRVRLGG